MFLPTDRDPWALGVYPCVVVIPRSRGLARPRLVVEAHRGPVALGGVQSGDDTRGQAWHTQLCGGGCL